MNVLGVTFDCKLTWSIHITNIINKACKALYSLRLLKKYFNKQEMRTLLDSNFYSILYYNSCIWLTPDLKADLKQNLLSISACALRSCVSFGGFDVSFECIHKNNGKSTPKQLMKYQISLSLHKLINANDETLTFDQVMVMDQTICTSRQLRFQAIRKFNHKVGMNIAANKFYHINNEISFDMLNLSFVHFKKICKIQYLKYGRT